jgi:polar amino acid transport system ATP-binding protein
MATGTDTTTPATAAPADVLPGRPIVDITALRKSYGTNEVLKGIDLKVQRGEVIAIIGKSGSGKSTLLRCINGLEVFQEGALSVNGQKLMHESPTAMRALRQQVGMIFQNFNLFPHLSVGRNIMLAPTLVKARDAKAAAEQARQLLTRVGLAEKFDAMPDQLSGGQQQRVAVARALVTSPALLLADEPTGNLDTKSAAEVFQLFRKFNREFGCAVLLVTHDPRLSEQCDRTIKLVDGNVESDDALG